MSAKAFILARALLGMALMLSAVWGSCWVGSWAPNWTTFPLVVTGIALSIIGILAFFYALGQL